ncbi:hypothetical protein [Actinomadura opuntiae]|uniref:hypothetical protein n=1 Tax=Actinomadura sp. OS1-43 TaxID=604315 RepID=UPI00255A7E42|nr:hypothetical protein [Actinomadura sp. OS1-43]MDL4813140.1 hypothetical protein [Actinomadura sp. OS1-43]
MRSDEVLRGQRGIDCLLDAPADGDELRQVFRDLRWLATVALAYADGAVGLLAGTDQQLIDRLARHADLPSEERGLVAADTDVLLRAAGLVAAARVVFADSLLTGGVWFFEEAGAWNELVFPLDERTGAGKWARDLSLIVGRAGGREDLINLTERHQVPPSRWLRPSAGRGSETV